LNVNASGGTQIVRIGPPAESGRGCAARADPVNHAIPIRIPINEQRLPPLRAMRIRLLWIGARYQVPCKGSGSRRGIQTARRMNNDTPAKGIARTALKPAHVNWPVQAW